MYFGRVSVKRQCIVTMVINRQGREDSMEDDGRINLSRSWKKPRNIDPPRFLFFRILFQLFRCSLCDLVTRNLRVTLCIYIYIFVKFSFIRFCFFFLDFTLSYLYRWSRIEKPIKLALFTRRPIQSFRKMASDRVRLVLFPFFERNNLFLREK